MASNQKKLKKFNFSRTISLEACLIKYMQAQQIFSIGAIFAKDQDQSTTAFEDDLIKRCRNGDQRAMEQIVKRYEKQVYNTAFGIVGNREDAQDITQDVFLTIWNKIGQFKFRSKFSTWIYQIAKNQSLNLKNLKKRRQTDATEIDDSQAWAPVDEKTPETTLLVDEQQKLLLRALDNLKEKHRTILVLREMEALSYDDISEVLGCSMGRVKSRLHEARLALRKAFLTI